MSKRKGNSKGKCFKGKDNEFWKLLDNELFSSIITPDIAINLNNFYLHMS